MTNCDQKIFNLHDTRILVADVRSNDLDAVVPPIHCSSEL